MTKKTGGIVIAIVSTILVMAIGYAVMRVSGLLTQDAIELIDGEGYVYDEDDSDADMLLAGSILNWLYDQRDSEGVYYLYRQCLEDGCEDVIDNRAGMFPIWARAQYYLKNPSEGHISVLEGDLDVYRSAAIVEEIQTLYWNCTLMVDIASDTSFPDSIREKAWQVCDRAIYDPPVMADVDKLVQSGVDGFLTDDTVEQLVSQDFLNKGLINDDTVLFEYGVYASEYFSRYRYTNDEEDLLRARAFVQLALDEYSKELEAGKVPLPRTSCVLGKAALDGYRVEDVGIYLEAAGYFAQIPSEWRLTLEDVSYCLFFVDDLSTVDERYLEVRDTLWNLAFEEKYDAFGYDGYVNGSGVFVETVEAVVHEPIPENALIIVFLTKYTDR